eukprot:TRINITY_DN36070_c0_g1_i4.p1 TRINITY_DN36070_c0_g1~~TRINITY_DN36070_c0_g1_i4.p1  ORF type:complete len:1167 (-),score=358.10 TRINITY_DN36070_c0_g1_i4:44-3544(-)
MWKKTLEEKWRLVLLQRASDTVSGEAGAKDRPERCCSVLLEPIPNLSDLVSIRLDLNSKPIRWIRMFLGFNGFENILGLVIRTADRLRVGGQSEEEKQRDEDIMRECMDCAFNIMNTNIGMKHVLACHESIRVLLGGFLVDDSHTHRMLLLLMAGVCHWSEEGFWLVLDALNNWKLTTQSASRLSTIAQLLENGNEVVQGAALCTLNSLVHSPYATLDVVSILVCDLVDMNVDTTLEQMSRVVQEESMSAQIRILWDIINEYRLHQSKIKDSGVNMHDAIMVAQYVEKHTKLSGDASYSGFLSLMQNVLFMTIDSREKDKKEEPLEEDRTPNILSQNLRLACNLIEIVRRGETHKHQAVMELARTREDLHLQTKQMEDMLTRMRYLEAKVFRLEEDKKMRASQPFSMLVADVMSDEKEHEDQERGVFLPEIDRLTYLARSTPSPRLQQDGHASGGEGKSPASVRSWKHDENIDLAKEKDTEPMVDAHDEKSLGQDGPTVFPENEVLRSTSPVCQNVVAEKVEAKRGSYHPVAKEEPLFDEDDSDDDILQSTRSPLFGMLLKPMDEKPEAITKTKDVNAQSPPHIVIADEKGVMERDDSDGKNALRFSIHLPTEASILHKHQSEDRGKDDGDEEEEEDGDDDEDDKDDDDHEGDEGDEEEDKDLQEREDDTNDRHSETPQPKSSQDQRFGETATVTLPSAPSAPAPPHTIAATQIGVPSYMPKWEPNTKMKPFHWAFLSERGAVDTVWKQRGLSEKTNTLHLRTADLESMFFSPTTSALVSLDKKKSSVEATLLHVLEPKRAQNIAILLNSAFRNVHFIELRHQILSVDEKALTLHQVKCLTQMAPLTWEIDALRSMRLDVNSLSEVEQFMVSIMNVSRLSQRLECWVTKRTFGAQLQDILHRIDDIRLSVNEVMGSERFFGVLSVILGVGNFLNAGTYRGVAVGFRLSSLEKLRDFKSVDKRTNLLAFVVSQVREFDPALSDFPAEMVHVRSPSLESIHSLFKSIDALEKAVGTIKDEVASSEYEESPSDRFKSIMNAFIASIDGEMTTLEKNVEMLRFDLQQLAIAFGEDPKVFDSEAFFGSVRKFTEEFQKECSFQDAREKMDKHKKKKKGKRGGKGGTGVEGSGSEFGEGEEESSGMRPKRGLLDELVAKLSNASAFSRRPMS